MESGDAVASGWSCACHQYTKEQAVHQCWPYLLLQRQPRKEDDRGKKVLHSAMQPTCTHTHGLSKRCQGLPQPPNPSPPLPLARMLACIHACMRHTVKKDAGEKAIMAEMSRWSLVLVARKREYSSSAQPVTCSARAVQWCRLGCNGSMPGCSDANRALPCRPCPALHTRCMKTKTKTKTVDKTRTGQAPGTLEPWKTRCPCAHQADEACRGTVIQEPGLEPGAEGPRDEEQHQQP